ncbi:hypothetical protein V0R50_00115 [Pseudomonas sp. 148P]|uniref:Uncharacterized protein n=1 Tax=Pseudomonas ulcerans TaxID=3115852 RepID=A0ABU7HJA1_9PSED|nr:MULTISPECIES: hypothetical protein [unclassified Pseudomonas]MEE1921324.1 hypothetical protein [Pseudomonas sp. 147P]MEE1931607.1 hypothetical protein [Pseudomonas sp. 148P]
MAHLQPFDMCFDVAGDSLTVKVEFGFHCFTDDKGYGELVRFKHERRYFCSHRYDCSKQLRDYMERRFYEGLAVPYFVNGNQRYYCLDLHDYAVFFSITKPESTCNLLKLRVISAYEVATWGRHSLPKGKPHNVRYILEMRNAGKSV